MNSTNRHGWFRSAARLAGALVLFSAWLSPVCFAQDTSATGASYIIGLGDVLNVAVWKDEELSSTVAVRPDGAVTIPLIGQVEVLGRAPSAVQEEVTQRLEQFVTAPAVSVTVEQINSRKVYVTGNVATPGEYDLIQPLRLLQVVAMAGGLNEFAKRDSVVLLRDTGGGQERYEVNLKGITNGTNLEANMKLVPGDTVFVP